MRNPSALITGVAGFVGSYLAEELLNHGYRVTGTMIQDESLVNIEPIRKQIEVIPLQVTDSPACQTLIAGTKPDLIFHLAAISSVGKSFGTVKSTFDVNVGGTLNLLDASLSHNKLKRFILISSADAYGVFKPATKTLTEKDPLNPISPYGISKSAAEQLCHFYYRVHGTPVLIARSFNHSGPRQSDNFVIPSFCKQIAMIEAGLQKPVLKVGDLSARRDISDVRDIVRGYRLLAEQSQPGETYQFCSGRAVSIDKVLQILLSLSDKKIRVETDKSRLRKADIPMLKGSCRKATRDIGFRPSIPLKETLTATLNYWRTKIGEPDTARQDSAVNRRSSL